MKPPDSGGRSTPDRASLIARARLLYVSLCGLFLILAIVSFVVAVNVGSVLYFVIGIAFLLLISMGIRGLYRLSKRE
jgi:Flp pilus assembly protein TadB